MMMDKDTVLPVGAGLRLCEVGGANQWKPGMSDAPGLGPGIISCQLQVERVPDLTWFMWGNMVIEATKPSVDRCWHALIGPNPKPDPSPDPNPDPNLDPNPQP